MADNENFLQTCSMNFDQAALVLNMLETHEEFAEVGMDIRIDLENFEPHICNSVREGDVLVIFDIPRNVKMTVFYGEFHKALNRETITCRSKEIE